MQNQHFSILPMMVFGENPSETLRDKLSRKSGSIRKIFFSIHKYVVYFTVNQSYYKSKADNLTSCYGATGWQANEFELDDMRKQYTFQRKIFSHYDQKIWFWFIKALGRMFSYIVILRALWWLLGSSGQMKLIKSTKCRLTFIFPKLPQNSRDPNVLRGGMSMKL